MTSWGSTSTFRASIFGENGYEVRSLHADVRDVERRSRRLDAVSHLAVVWNDPVGNLNPQATHDSNHLASLRVTEKAKES
jgi:hypothetical protein